MTPIHPRLRAAWLRCFLAGALWTFASTAPSAQAVTRVFPMEPVNGATIGGKPVFQLGYEGEDLVKSKFKIELSQDDFETVAFSFDQQKDDNGWAYTALGGESGAIYRVRKPLPGGTYKWRVFAWNGLDWVLGDRTFGVTVDVTPPADVEGIVMTVDRAKKAIRLDWMPVVTDRNGKPELVARYHIYRYKTKTFFFVVRPFEIGVTEDTTFEDHDPTAYGSPLIFYKISAEDVAGNEPDRRY